MKLAGGDLQTLANAKCTLLSDPGSEVNADWRFGRLMMLHICFRVAGNSRQHVIDHIGVLFARGTFYSLQVLFLISYLLDRSVNSDAYILKKPSSGRLSAVAVSYLPA